MVGLMFSREPKGQQFTPIADFLTAALTLYARGAVPFIATAMVGALAANFLALLANPTSTALALLWGLPVAAATLGALAPTAYLVVLASRGERLTAGAALSGLIAFGPRFFASGLALGLVAIAVAVSASFTAFASPLIVIVAVYALLRISLTGPAIILENRSVPSAMARSWRLIGGRWWRTFVIQFLVGVFSFILLYAAGGLGVLAGNVLVTIVATSLAQALATPLFAAVELLMFEEYREAVANELPRPPLEPDDPPESDESTPPP